MRKSLKVAVAATSIAVGVAGLVRLGEGVDKTIVEVSLKSERDMKSGNKEELRYDLQRLMTLDSANRAAEIAVRYGDKEIVTHLALQIHHYASLPSFGKGLGILIQSRFGNDVTLAMAKEDSEQKR